MKKIYYSNQPKGSSRNGGSQGSGLNWNKISMKTIIGTILGAIGLGYFVARTAIKSKASNDQEDYKQKNRQEMEATKQSNRERMEETKQSNREQMEDKKHAHRMELIDHKAALCVEEREAAKAEWEPKCYAGLGGHEEKGTALRTMELLEAHIDDACTDPHYYVDTPIAENEIVIITSPPKVGKSTLVVQMLTSISSGIGTGLLNPKVQYGSSATMPTVYLYDSENSPQVTRRRYEGMDLKPFIWISTANFPTIEGLMTDIDNHIFNGRSTPDSSVVAIDNITAMFDALPANKVRYFFNCLRKLQFCAKKTNISLTFIVVAHTKDKSLRTAGSINWERFGEKLITLSGNTEEDDDASKVMTIALNRNGEQGVSTYLKRVPTPWLHFECDTARNKQYLGEECPMVFSVDDDTNYSQNPAYVKEATRLYYECGLGCDTIAKKIGGSPSTVARVVKAHPPK